jgi:hypothetical protein
MRPLHLFPRGNVIRRYRRRFPLIYQCSSIWKKEITSRRKIPHVSYQPKADSTRYYHQLKLFLQTQFKRLKVRLLFVECKQWETSWVIGPTKDYVEFKVYSGSKLSSLTRFVLLQIYVIIKFVFYSMIWLLIFQWY